MLVLLSPSKTQNFETPAPTTEHTQPALLQESSLLMKELAKLSAKKIGRLMDVSEKIAALNHGRFKQFKTPFTLTNAKQAVFAFQGDVYDGLKVESLDKPSLAFAQAHIRILSGLYGVLRPLDLIQPYRLEMKIKLPNPRGKDLYTFWDNRLSALLNAEMPEKEPRVIVNLASQEYFKAITKGLDARIITPQFKEKKNGVYKMIALFAKQARGSMAHYIASRKVIEPEALMFFADDGYRYNAKLSTAAEPVFTRG